ncbi:MAG: hypothetical protein ACMXYC_02825 [Candidatus Woesearchaeota archaeon]
MIKPIIKIMQQRQAQLLKTYKSGAISLAQKHQVYGALQEMQLIIKTLEQQHEILVNKPYNPFDLQRITEQDVQQAFKHQYDTLQEQALQRDIKDV